MFKGSSSRKGIVKKLRGKRQEKNRFLKPRRLNVESWQRRQLLAAVCVLSIACPTLTGKDSPLFVVSISPGAGGHRPRHGRLHHRRPVNGCRRQKWESDLHRRRCERGHHAQGDRQQPLGRNHAPGVHDVIAPNPIPLRGVTGSSAAIATILQAWQRPTHPEHERAECNHGGDCRGVHH